jgi:lipopolysaccharide transport system permease protein
VTGGELTGPRDLLGGRASRVWGASAQSRELLLELLRRDLKSRYKGSSLGAFWSLLNPLLYMLVYTAVFSHFMRFRVVGAPYPVYLLSGLLAWNFYGQAVIFSAGSVLGNGSIVKKVRFPWVLLTLSAVLAAFVNYLISLALLVPLVIFFHVSLGLPLVVAPVIALITLVFALGVGLLVASANVFFRDVEYLINIALQVWFFMTPIIYQLDSVLHTPGSDSFLGKVLRVVLYVNPMTWVVSAFQDVIAFDRWPQHPTGLLYSTAVAFVALAVGSWVFHRLRPRFAEEL